MRRQNMYFSDIFNVDETIIENYGAINISLINDLPLFIDPFLLFNSNKPEYQTIHESMIRYLMFLKNESLNDPAPSRAKLLAWYYFPEIKQTWLGFSLSGNSGRGMGMKFAKNLHSGLRTIYKEFGTETITESAHIEKLCLISPLVGKDKISDFTTNFAKKHILNYTETFAKNYLSTSQCKNVMVPKVEFSYQTNSWTYKEYTLPWYNGDYVLLTPRNLLTREKTYINRSDMLNRIQTLAPAIEDEILRFQLNQYLSDVLSDDSKMTKKEKEGALNSFVRLHPEIMDYYIREKEESKSEASSISIEKVYEVQKLFNEQLPKLIDLLKIKTDFYKESDSSYKESLKRVMFLKNVIEDMDGYRIFYVKGKPIKRESDLQVMFRLVWYSTEYDVNRETNNGRGPVDYKISKGSKDKSLVEFKLASNSKLKMNLKNQVKTYQKANNTNESIVVILYFSKEEYEKTIQILDELKIQNKENIVLINAINNKPSASMIDNNS